MPETPQTTPPTGAPAAAPNLSASSDRGLPAAPTAPRRNKFLRMVALMGPAFIVGAWQFGPGNLVSAVQAGSRFYYSLIWVIAVSTVLMLMFADMSIRVGVMGRGSLVETIKESLGKATGVATGLGVFSITLMFSVGNAVGAGLGLSIVLGGSPVLWTLACTAVVAAILFARHVYKVIEKIVLVIVAVMAASFIATAVIAKPDWAAAGAGLVPEIPPGVGLLLVALIGTNFSLNAAFYAGYASRERGLRPDQYRETTLADTIPGIVAPGVMTALVIAAAAAVLGGQGGDRRRHPRSVLRSPGARRRRSRTDHLRTRLRGRRGLGHDRQRDRRRDPALRRPGLGQPALFRTGPAGHPRRPHLRCHGHRPGPRHLPHPADHRGPGAHRDRRTRCWASC